VLESVALLTILASIFLRSRDPRIPAVAMFSVFALTAVGPLGVNAVVERSAQNHPHVVGTQSDSTSDDGFPKEPSRQLHIATYSTVDRWMTTFSCSDYSVTSRQASVTIEPTGVLIVVHHEYKDTLRFNLPSTLRKLSPTDSIIPPITTYSFDGKRRGTLVISSISTDLTSRDTLSPGKRTLSFIQGAVYCEPTTAPHF
jgi:hypothetical protein